MKRLLTISFLLVAPLDPAAASDNNILETRTSKKTFSMKWEECFTKKNSILCVGLDPVEFTQGEGKTIPDGVTKFDWCSSVIKKVAPYASAIKINRNFIKDLSRQETSDLCSLIHSLGMVAIDDSKLSDIGSSNEAGFYQAAQEGFDAVTYSPFAGNVIEATQQAHKHGLGIITLVLMSNPDYKTTKESVIKDAELGEVLFYQHLTKMVASARADAVVIGAPSPTNHLRVEEIQYVSGKLSNQIVLVPGIGAQGGEAALLLSLFGKRAIINVGRDIIFDSRPAQKALSYRDMFNEGLKQ